jgi:hypothetical protein
MGGNNFESRILSILSISISSTVKKTAGGSPAIFIFNVPRHAVCCVILNLLSQGGNLPSGPALAEAYRFALVR